MGAEVYRCEAHESVVLDTTRIMILRRSLGDQRTREVVEEVVFHLNDRLTLLQQALESGSTAEAQTIAQRLASLSEQVGLPIFARVSRDLACCVERGDSIASAAVAARLGRLADDSLFSVIDYAEQSAL